MLGQSDPARLHVFQNDLAIRHDWFAVGKLKGLIDLLAVAQRIRNNVWQTARARALRHWD